MNQEVMATYLKWGQRKTRILITVIICGGMLLSLGIQGLTLYRTLNSSQNIDIEQMSKPHRPPQALSVKDFDLLFGSNDNIEVQNKSAEIPNTKLSLTLKGALTDINHKNEDSSAIIQGSNQEQLYSLGDTLPGGATLKEIFPDHVILSRNGQLEKLFFPDTADDSRTLQEYKNSVEANPNQANDRPGVSQQPDDKSLEERMQELREKLQQANQGIK